MSFDGSMTRERDDAAVSTGSGGRQANGGNIPPLVAGDHLSRAEFERRYHVMPHVKKAELVEGIVYMPSPTYHTPHGKPHSRIVGWLLHYVAATPGVDMSDNASLRLDSRNEVQPDALLFLEPRLGGGCRIGKDNFLEGSPELVVEVAASSAAYDLHSKLRAYQRNRVQEYLALLTFEPRIVWHVLTAGKYVPMMPDDDGILRSRVFPGLWLHPGHFWADDINALLAVLREGLASPDHAEFVARYSSLTSSNPTAIK
jgi:Uma2 family endonuclease